MLSLTLGSRSESCRGSGTVMKLWLRALSGHRMGHPCLGGDQLGAQNTSVDMVPPGSATSAWLLQDPGVTADEHRVLHSSRYEGGRTGCSRTVHWLWQSPAGEWDWVPTWGIAQGAWPPVRGVGVQRDCCGVLPLLHTQSSVWDPKNSAHVLLPSLPIPKVRRPQHLGLHSFRDTGGRH